MDLQSCEIIGHGGGRLLAAFHALGIETQEFFRFERLYCLIDGGDQRIHSSKESFRCWGLVSGFLQRVDCFVYRFKHAFLRSGQPLAVLGRDLDVSGARMDRHPLQEELCVVRFER